MLLRASCFLSLVWVAVLFPPSALTAQSDWKPPVRLTYEKQDGIYLLTYASTTQSPVFERKLEAALAMSYVKGVSHHQEWRTLEPREGVYDWRELDLVFDLARKHGKQVILGVQAGVMAPAWLLRKDGVRTVDFVHNNPGWTAWSTLKIPATVTGKNVTLSRMALPWDLGYNAALYRTLARIAARYDGESGLTYVNVCGPSASGGVEANFNINWTLSRAAVPDFDRKLGFTLARYVAAWKAAIDAHFRVFRKSTLGMGNHTLAEAPWGFAEGPVVTYTSAEQMRAAREIRDYLLRRHLEERGTSGVVRNCGLNAASMWGDPDRVDDKPASNFTALQWEVRDRAKIGYECMGVNSRNSDAGIFARVVRNGITGYGRYLEIKTPDIVRETAWGYGPYEPYRPVLEEAARIMSPP